jgi:CO/xanthine dehydrogenase Mo-binding subunit
MDARTDPARDHTALSVNRRRFLVGSAGAGLMMAFTTFPAGGQTPSQQLGAKRFSPAIWFEMSADGVATINIKRADMGQHVGTSLARILADELELDWNDARILHVDSDPKWGQMVTGGSWSVFQSFTELSQAGAAGRIALIDAGAKILGVPASECRARASQVLAGNRAVSYAELVRTAKLDRQFTDAELKALPVKPISERRLISKPAPQLDIPVKTNGTAKYGIDATLPGMVYARPVAPPTRLGSKIISVDDSEARKIPGYLSYVVIEDASGYLQGWAAVVAETYPAAHKAAGALSVTWDKSPTAEVDEAKIIAEGDRLCADPKSGAHWVKDGDVDAALGQAAHTVSARYTTASVMHLPMEPVNALATQENGVWHIHAGNQWQNLIIPVLAKSLGVDPGKIVIHQYYLGGGFGRRLWGDYMIPAALTSKAVGRPVKMVYAREDDARIDCVRSASVQTLKAGVDGSGKILGLDHAAAAGWPTLALAGAAAMPNAVDGNGKVDNFSIAGADHWYSFPNHRVRAINNTVAQTTFTPGWLRSVGPGWTMWAVESFMDEIAHATGQDAAQLRLSLLDGAGKQAGKAPESVGGATRLAAALRRLMEKVNWGKETLPPDTGVGLALGFGQERTMPTWTACAARVHVDRTSGKITVEKITQVIDCGTRVSPDGALAQAEGATLWGASLALHESTRFEAGAVKDRNFDTYTPLRMRDVPELDVEFIDSDEFPVGMGEPPLIVVAPAIGNAVFNAVGVRLRDLPMRPEAVLKALQT